MATMNLTCVICTDFYKNTDSVISTSCGHVFHDNCMQEWRIRSSQCPSCRATMTTIYRLYLNFEENFSERDKQLVELKSKMEQHIKQSSVLQQQLEQSEREFLQLEEQYSKKDDEIRDLFKQIEYLTLQNDTRSHEIEVKTIEIHKLQEALNNADPQSTTIMLQEEIKILKEKNKQITNELNKEIRNCTQLSVDKMKLESKLEHAKSMPTPSSSARPQDKKSDGHRNNNNDQARQKRLERPDSSLAGNLQKNRGCVQSVIIKNVKGTFLDEEALKSFVFKLSDLMGLFYSGDDLEQVTVMERRPNDLMSLIAKFKNVSLKGQFVSRKDKLKGHMETNNLLLLEHAGEHTTALFHYARTLKPLGYKHIYVKNNQVFVRKEDGSTPTRIRNHEDIERLKHEASNQSNENRTTAVPTADAATLESIIAALRRQI